MSENKEKLDIYNALARHVDNLLKADERPNILLLLTDQQRFDTIAAAGYSHMKTPNLDRLAGEGCLYENAYTPNPICCPARHNLITGLSARYHGLADNEYGVSCDQELDRLPSLLARDGYDCRMIGKTHYVPVREHNGFSNLELMDEVPEYRNDDEFAKYLKNNGYGHIQNLHGVRNLLYMSPQQSLLPDEHHGTKWVADRSIDYLENHDYHHPFFLFSGFIAPHPPFNVPQGLKDCYKGVDIPKPYQSKTDVCALAKENMAWCDLPTDEHKKRMRECYYTQITFIDEQVGRILDKLEELGQIDNTVIIFTSDHGEMLGDYNCYQKFLPYNSASKIPMIIRYPKKLKPNTRETGYVDLNDIMPTVLDAVSINYTGKHKLIGESLFASEKEKDRNYQFVEYSRDSRRWVSILSPTYKYNYFFGGGNEELFDLVNDPNETENILATNKKAEYETIRCDLRQRLIDYDFKHGLLGDIENGDFIKLDEYIPNPNRNSAFPIFPMTLKPQEKENMNNFFDEIIEATKNEEIVHLKDYDIKAWLKNTRLPKEGLEKFLNTIGYVNET